jgi:hypothetical protein
VSSSALPNKGPDDLQADYRLDVYKRLRDESWACIDHVPGLWLQKFVVLGATIAFMVQFQDQVQAYAGMAKPLALCSLPLVAALIDAKILEYTIQARLISQFIQEHYADIGLAISWERSVWGVSHNAFARYRSFTSLFVTMAPTMMLFVLAAGAAATAETALFIWTGAIGGIIIYLVLFSVVWRNIFVRTQARIFPSAGTGSASATGGGRLPPTGLR